MKYKAVCEIQSYGHYTELAQCVHSHHTKSAALTCALEWQRREGRNRHESRDEAVSNGARFVVKEAE